MSQQTESIVEETKKQTERASALRAAVSELTLAVIADTYGSKNDAMDILLSALRAWESAAATCKESDDTANYETCFRESLAYQAAMNVLAMKQ